MQIPDTTSLFWRCSVADRRGVGLDRLAALALERRADPANSMYTGQPYVHHLAARYGADPERPAAVLER